MSDVDEVLDVQDVPDGAQVGDVAGELGKPVAPLSPDGEAAAEETEREGGELAEATAEPVAGEQPPTAGEGVPGQPARPASVAGGANALPKKPEPDPIIRQSLPCKGGQCNVRMGAGALQNLGREVKALVGKPRLALLVASDAVRPHVLKLLRRQLADGEFRVAEVEVEAGAACRDLSHAGKLLKRMAKAGLTADDVVVAVGDTDVLSLASFAAGTWCGGVALVMVALDALGCLEPALSPRALGVKGMDNAVVVRSNPKMLYCDFSEFDPTQGPDAMMVRAMAVATATADNQNALNRLATRSEAMAAGDVADTSAQIIDTAKSRARMTSSASVAVRQGLEYGKALAGVLARHLPDAMPAELLAEGLRFESRLVISIEESVDVDTVFAQDALLDRLGLHEVPCDLDPAELARELREECFRRSNRFLLTLPLGVGKVRLTSVPDDVLAEHLDAFCRARRALL